MGAAIRSPRWRRVLSAMLTGPQTSRDVVEVAGCVSPATLVWHMRRGLGLSLPATERRGRDRDDRPCRVVSYSLTAADRERVRRLLKGAP